MKVTGETTGGGGLVSRAAVLVLPSPGPVRCSSGTRVCRHRAVPCLSCIPQYAAHQSLQPRCSDLLPEALVTQMPQFHRGTWVRLCAHKPANIVLFSVLATLSKEIKDEYYVLRVLARRI